MDREHNFPQLRSGFLQPVPGRHGRPPAGAAGHLPGAAGRLARGGGGARLPPHGRVVHPRPA
eukprot:12344533-Alexandrium_andersonii.AAC.1